MSCCCCCCCCFWASVERPYCSVVSWLICAYCAIVSGQQYQRKSSFCSLINRYTTTNILPLQTHTHYTAAQWTCIAHKFFMLHVLLCGQHPNLRLIVKQWNLCAHFTQMRIFASKSGRILHKLTADFCFKIHISCLSSLALNNFACNKFKRASLQSLISCCFFFPFRTRDPDCF